MPCTKIVRWTCVVLLTAGCAGNPGETDRRDVGPRADTDTDGASRPDTSVDAPLSDSALADEGPDDATTEDSTADTRPMCSPSQTLCGADCVDTRMDLAHCGGCDSPCSPPNATPRCAAGACGVAACRGLFLDCNGRPDDGCETPNTCSTGTACETSCGSTGTTSCADACSPACNAPAEVCNHADDDCDGDCDEGRIAGCRVGVHRAYAPSSGFHLYTTNLDEARSFGLEFANYFYVYAAMAPGLRAFYRCRKGNGGRFYTASASCEGGGTNEGILGYVGTDDECGSRALYRLFLDSRGDHFYSSTAGERDSAIMGGYRYESVAGYIWTTP